MISKLQSSEIISDPSTNLPSIFPATAAFARPVPMSLAISSTLKGLSKFLVELSGSFIDGNFFYEIVN